ncbi:substrate-binding periplasmic protein [Marinobacter algicola]|uniref:ABC-type amino acid transport/signal transduction system, periplasmic component/domain n=1 Tax=Marinobacter algicola DG893 TaxID=443152 RepID=A6EY94_9GAMM|nr:ABC transporter substrate-binding protein [Marinobacter algicola]EDM48502.1 ABC-type amino acid transport/signal transduction system, periplasmic component/domain [Marinobacter algicola DG893]
MRNLPVFLLAALVLMMGVSSAQASDKLYLYTENFPPYNMSATGRAFEHNGSNIDGLCTEMVKAILNNTDLDYVIKLRNWDYGYNRALSKRNHGIFCTTYTESRAPRFKWVGPLTRNLWTIFAPAGTDLQIDRLEDAKGLRFGGYRNDVMTEYLLERGYEVSALDSDDLNPKRLELGQIDLWIADRLAGPYFASQQNVEGLDPVYSFNDTELFLAINLDTPDATVEKLNAGLRKVHETGMFEAIETKYGL